MVGVTQTQISNLENGSRSLKIWALRRIAKALGVYPADLLSDDDNPNRLAPDEAQLIEHYRAATNLQREMLRRIMKPLTDL